ncbi:DUF2264 domain-containing protein [Pedobacter sp. MC2016-14]|uniref:DUF2264 domain-containing protein n=1 Tax=Pedobacter sp. MC2016-14 TaxID=2897327 RepID=UPI001E564D56|nr:DUF2264 domain-containing protein [Pedobacter sp. MC2016-14]MCD0487579.1 DUF2264 domain-containing protein [Pedobacter sp. MC2016-14]
MKKQAISSAVVLMVFLVFACVCCCKAQNKAMRNLWIEQLDKVARPVLLNLSQDKLKSVMPVTVSAVTDNKEERTKVAYLEAFGRTLSGIAPWLNLTGGTKQEQQLRAQYFQWSLKSIDNATNPAAKDYMEWREGTQPLVDASYVALAFIRCPALWEQLDARVKKQVVDALQATRAITPYYNNWLLFSGMIEAFFCKYNHPYDELRINYGITQFMNYWYTGDGLFADGPEFTLDYYNSFVIQPYLSTIMEVVNEKQKRYANEMLKLDKISKRYAEIQERFINADGSFPATGRSIVYRGGAFQHLANMALKHQLPASLKPAQVREALNAVIHKTLTAPANFSNGWLNIGLSGSQPALADFYNNTGSLYICTAIFLPLGLPETDEFWSAAPAPWSAIKIWAGQNAPGDHALHLK